MAEREPFLRIREQPDTRWMRFGACADLTKEKRRWFYPGNVVERDKAIRICENECPVKSKCGQYADETEEKEGIWGGVLRGQIMRRNDYAPRR